MKNKWERIRVSGNELIKMARDTVDKEMLDQAAANPVFQDFVRVCILMSMATAATKEASSFGHVFVLRDPTGKTKNDQTTIEFQVQITSIKDERT